VAFDVANAQVMNFRADGLWNCPNGAAELIAQVPGSYPIEGGNFTIDTHAPVAGYDTRWKISGHLEAAGPASGSFTETSDIACSRQGAPWKAN
jgi:hypothetical protein